MRCAFVQQQPYTYPTATDELPQNCVHQGQRLSSAARNVNPKIAAMVTEGHPFPYPPASAERISKQSSSLSEVEGSLTNRSPFRFATKEGCSRLPAITSPRAGICAVNVPSN